MSTRRTEILKREWKVRAIWKNRIDEACSGLTGWRRRQGASGRQRRCARTRSPHRASPGCGPVDAMTGLDDPRQALSIEVDQVARMLVLVADDRGRWVERAKAIHPARRRMRLTVARLSFTSRAILHPFQRSRRRVKTSLVTQIIIFALRTRRHLFASRPDRALTGLALSATAFTLAFSFLPGVGQWFGFVHPPTSYFAFLSVVVAAILVSTELAKRAFYGLMDRTSGH